MSPRFLIIRFSSFGDIIQALTVTRAIREKHPDAQIDWLVRSDFAQVLSLNKSIGKIWSYERVTGLRGLIAMAKEIKEENYDYVYDAHNNLRSTILKLYLRKFRRVATRSKSRLKRFLLFRLGYNFFPWPFRGMLSYQRPLRKWGISISKDYPQDAIVPQELLNEVKKMLPKNDKKVIALVPSAAWKMKRWPLSHWRRLIKILPGYTFIILGGPEDTFCEELVSNSVINLAGKLSLLESCAMIQIADYTISADTGLIHVADYLGKKGIALIGPTAFGFTTSRKIELLDVALECRPCSKDGRGKCSQEVYQKCMIDITPERVANCLRRIELTSGS